MAPVTVETDPEFSEYDLYTPSSGSCRYGGTTWDIIGLDPGRPIRTGRDGELLILKNSEETASVVKGGALVWSYRYENFSGDWAAATFSPDGRFIVLGCPYGFNFLVFERCP